ncbi:MAG: ROK family protein [Chloroflexota bacterium]
MPFAKTDYVVGIDLGGTKILSGVIDAAGRVLARSASPTLAIEPTPNLVIDRIVQSVHHAVKQAGLSLEDVTAIGCSAPGPVNVHTGWVLSAPNIPGWQQGYSLGPELQKRLNRPVLVDNDVNLGTLGEATYGAGRGISDLVGVFVGTGIGGGVILNGKLRRGRRWLAGEVGHITIERNGPLCVCGLKGHADVFAAGGPINRRLAQAIQAGEAPILQNLMPQPELNAIPGEAILQALQAGDEATRRIIAEAQEVLGLLIATVVNLLDPDCIVMGGGVIENLGQPFLQAVRETAFARIFQHDRADPIKIVPAALGRDAVILGCAVLARTGA